jgi:subtilisin-like proprotein convertase family protein
MIRIVFLSLFFISFITSCSTSPNSTADAPDTSPDVSNINEQATLINTAKTVSLFATDSTYNEALSFSAVSSDINVTPSISDSTLTLTPSTGFTGTATVTVKAYDGISYSAGQDFTFKVCASACAPVLNVVNNEATTKNTAKNITLAGTDANGDSLTYSATSSNSNVTPSISGTTLTLTPATDWTGTATITAKASDAALDSNVKTFRFKVCKNACLPSLASISNQSTTEDVAKVFTLVGSDPDGDSLAYSVISSTCNVTTSVSGSTLTLHPKANWSGTATITAQVNDGTHVAAQAFVLTVSAVNDAPVLSSIPNQTTNEDTAKTYTMSATDVEGSSLTYLATSSNSSNVATGISGATVTMTPAANFNGSVTITAKANDGTVDSAAKTFTLTVGAVNDAPVVGTVSNQTTAEDTAKTVTLSVTDSDSGDSHTYSATSSTSNVTPSISGTTLSLTPAANWSGTATITIKANDGTVYSAAKTFTLTVSAVNDAPVLASVSNQVTVKNAAKTVTLSGTDVEGSSLTYSATTSASQITIAVSSAVLTLTPDNNWVGTSTITAKVNDGTVDSATKTFTITVNNTNTAPVVGTVANQSTNEDTAKTVTLSGTDSDGDSLTYSATSAASQVTPSVSGTTLTLTPAANWNGTSVITIKANDGIVDSTAKTFTLTVNAINDAPVVGTVANQSTTKNSAKTVNLSETDADSGDSHTFTATTSASQITIGISGAALTMTPDNNWTGTSTITIKANDGTVDSAAKTFVLTVSSSNATPTLAAISAQATNQSVKKTVSITAADGDGDSLSYTVTSSPSSKVNGTVSGSTLTLTPLASYSGTAAVTLTVSDGTATAARTFNLVVTANDPLYKYQWHIDNTGGSDSKNFSNSAGTSGQDHNVDGVITDGYTGNGVIIAITDSGLDIDHEDLAANVVSNGSYDWCNSDADPSPSSSGGDHGTSVAGLSASVGWNAKGGRGVAPGASLKGFNVLCGSVSTANFLRSLGSSSWSQSQDVDIFNESWGWNRAYDSLINTSYEAAWLGGVTNLRSGKGALYVKSTGNGFTSYSVNCASIWGSRNNGEHSCQSTNHDPDQTIPYQIGVAALTATGVATSYSTGGSGVWVAGAGGEHGRSASGGKPAMMTTDLAGCSAGYVKSGTSGNNPFNNQGNHSENSSCNYTSTFNGTSSAAPVVSGGIALILEANSALTWRDVKHILASTSDQVHSDISAISENNYAGQSMVIEPAWLTNAAGYKFHNWYGFGRMNVGAAVAAAKSMTANNLGTFTTSSWQDSGTLNTTITGNHAAGITNAMSVSGANFIEAVQIKVNIAVACSGAIQLELTSPSGTKSVLKNAFDGFGGTANLTNWVLLSNTFYGESKAGNWTLKVIDGYQTGGCTAGTLQNWSIRFFGH